MNTATSMAQGARITTMATEHATPALLRLMWLASPALPIGGFSYSEGLEAAVASGLVHDAHSAGDWLVEQLHLSQSRGDMAVLHQFMLAWRAHDVPRLQALSDWVHQTRESAELRLQSEQMGRSLLAWLQHLAEVDEASLRLCQTLGPTYPLIMALALTHTGASLEQCLQTYAFGWSENMVQAAIKSVPLGQNAGQSVLARLVREVPQAVAHAMTRTDAQRQAFSPMLAILSAQHETQYSRLFRS